MSAQQSDQGSKASDCNACFGQDDRGLPPSSRRENLQVRTEADGMLRLFRTLVHKSRRGGKRAWVGWLHTMAERPENRLKFAAKRIWGKESLIIATSIQHPRGALRLYRRRWGIECLFSDAKTRGFNIVNTHITDSAKLATLLGIVTLAQPCDPAALPAAPFRRISIQSSEDGRSCTAMCRTTGFILSSAGLPMRSSPCSTQASPEGGNQSPMPSQVISGCLPAMSPNTRHSRACSPVSALRRALSSSWTAALQPRTIFGGCAPTPIAISWLSQVFGATLDGAEFTGSDLTGAAFYRSGIDNLDVRLTDLRRIDQDRPDDWSSILELIERGLRKQGLDESTIRDRLDAITRVPEVEHDPGISLDTGPGD